MQTDYLFNRIKGYSTFKRFSYLFDMDSKEANNRLKVVQFYEKYGLNVTIEAFDISKRTILDVALELNEQLDKLFDILTKKRYYLLMM